MNVSFMLKFLRASWRAFQRRIFVSFFFVDLEHSSTQNVLNCYLNNYVVSENFLRIWCHLDTLTWKNIIFKKILPTPVNSTVKMKVVIPNRVYSAVFKAFSIPRDGYEIFDHDIWGKETSDDSFQISKTKFHMRSTFSEQLLKIVEKIAKIIVFETKKLRFLLIFRCFSIFFVDWMLTPHGTWF